MTATDSLTKDAYAALDQAEHAEQTLAHVRPASKDATLVFTIQPVLAESDHDKKSVTTAQTMTATEALTKAAHAEKSTEKTSHAPAE